MDDRELLELAAKAVGAKTHPPSAASKNPKYTAEGFSGWFNPLHFKDQIIVLAAKLDISIRLEGDELTAIAHWYRGGRIGRVVGSYRTGSVDDVAKLVVRAAAEIGRAM